MATGTGTLLSVMRCNTYFEKIVLLFLIVENGGSVAKGGPVWFEIILTHVLLK